MAEHEVPALPPLGLAVNGETHEEKSTSAQNDFLCRVAKFLNFVASFAKDLIFTEIEM